MLRLSNFPQDHRLHLSHLPRAAGLAPNVGQVSQAGQPALPRRPPGPPHAAGGISTDLYAVYGSSAEGDVDLLDCRL